MAVTASMVKELREMTGAGMMDCKKALSATDGDMDAAVDFLREKGLAAAQKKASRIAAEGIVNVLVEGNKAVAVEVNSETDFVAKNEKFQEYVANVAKQAINTSAADIDAFLAEPWALDTTKTVAEELSTQISIIGEKLSIRRFAQVEGTEGPVASYIHGGGRIGVIVESKCAVDNDEVREALKHIAMQVAALKPQYVCREDMSQEFIDKETEILKKQAMQENPDKPENIIEKMIGGRLNKELKEFCLVDQVYIMAEDGKSSVGAYLKDVSKKIGADLTIKSFVRFETGEGLEKKEENFAEEVAKQMQ